MILGVDLGGTSIQLGVLDDGILINRNAFPSPSHDDEVTSLRFLIDCIKTIITPQVKGIGIGVPSIVDVERGIVYDVVNIPSWKEVPLKSILEQEFGIPVFVNNDSNCFALGELYFGQGKGYNHIIAITLGTGVGAGVIIDGKLYDGQNTGAGEIGCITYLEQNFEYYCASNYFEHFYHTTGKKVFQLAELGNQDALQIWNEFGHHLGMLIQTVLYTYDPQVIILGGSISKAYRYFEESMKQSLETFSYPSALQNLLIKISDNEDVALLGAAGLVDIKH